MTGRQWGGGGRGGRGHGGRGRGRGGRGSESTSSVWKGDGNVPLPSKAILNLEDRILGGPVGRKMGVSPVGPKAKTVGKPLLSFPKRPAYGTEGKQIVLWANYFRVIIPEHKKLQLTQYSLNVEERLTADEVLERKMVGLAGSDLEVKPGPMRREVIKMAMSKLPDKGRDLATEYKSQLISREPLGPSDRITIEVQYPRGKKEQEYEVTLSKTTPPLNELMAWLNSMPDPKDLKNEEFPKFPDAVNALQIVLGHDPRSSASVTAIGSRFFPTNDQTMSQLLGEINKQGSFKAVFQGFSQSLRPATGGLLLNVNVTHAVFRAAGNLGDMFGKMKLAGMEQLDGMTPTLRSAYFNRLRDVSKVLSGARIHCEVRDRENQAKTVVKVIRGLANNKDRDRQRDWDPRFTNDYEFGGPKQTRFFLAAPDNPSTTPRWAKGELPSGQHHTVMEYHERRYGLGLNSSLPLINVGQAKKPIYLPAEWCEILPGQAIKGKLSPNEAREMILFACREPHLNAKSIVHNGTKTLNLQGNPLLAKFGISVEKQLMTVYGRILEPPAVVYHHAQTVNSVDGAWNMRDVKVFKPGPTESAWHWCYIISDGRRGSEQDIEDVKQALKGFVEHITRKMGVNMAPVPRNPNGLIIKTRDGSELGDIRTGFEQLYTIGKMPPQFMVVVVPDNKSPGVYNAVKKLADVDYGFHTVCVVREKFTKTKGVGGEVKYDLQYFANVALKVNLKQGGINHRLKNELGIIRDGSTMVVRYDVIHPTDLNAADAKNLPSQVGLVASIDKELAQWPATSWNQLGGKELLSDKLQEAFESRLKLWKKFNKGRLPINIVVYRDGVSESQYIQVIEKELPLMRAACASAGHKDTRITIIVSVKRHQTRFYPTLDKKGDRNWTGNVTNGTVVDRGVTLARYWDFFLVAHKAIKGTARPARYTVIHDDIFKHRYNKEAANQLQKLTHELCYLFGRATKAVSICPPAYYADIVCTRARVHISDFFEQAETATTTSGTSGVEPPPPPQRSVHQNIADDMYYI